MQLVAHDWMGITYLIAAMIVIVCDLNHGSLQALLGFAAIQQAVSLNYARKRGKRHADIRDGLLE